MASAFVDFYGEPIPENVNATHSMMIVASELDESSERIVQYLAEEHGVSINAVYFNFFRFDDQEFLGRAWLIDPIELQERSEERRQAAWSGYWFVNVGEGPNRNWDDNVQYGFIGAGQGARFSAALKRIQPRDNIFA